MKKLEYNGLEAKELFDLLCKHEDLGFEEPKGWFCGNGMEVESYYFVIYGRETKEEFTNDIINEINEINETKMI